MLQILEEFQQPHHNNMTTQAERIQINRYGHGLAKYLTKSEPSIFEDSLTCECCICGCSYNNIGTTRSQH